MDPRVEINAQIAELDKKINGEVAGQRAPDYGKMRRFPGGMWTLTVLAYLWYVYGLELGSFLPAARTVHSKFGDWGLYGAYVFGALASLQTVLWFPNRNPKHDPVYNESAARVRELQEERRALVAKLKSLE